VPRLHFCYCYGRLITQDVKKFTKSLKCTRKSADFRAKTARAVRLYCQAATAGEGWGEARAFQTRNRWDEFEQQQHDAGGRRPFCSFCAFFEAAGWPVINTVAANNIFSQGFVEWYLIWNLKTYRVARTCLIFSIGQLHWCTTLTEIAEFWAFLGKAWWNNSNILLIINNAAAGQVVFKGQVAPAVFRIFVKYTPLQLSSSTCHLACALLLILILFNSF